jgi:hypothetical protein
VQNKTPSLGETRTHTRNNALISHDRWFPDRTVRWSGRTARRGMQAQRPKPRAGVGSHASLASAIRRVAVHIATHILAFEGESKVTFFDGTVRRAGRVARRGLHGRRPGRRVSGRGPFEAMAQRSASVPPLPRVRGLAPADPRRRRHPPAPDNVQEADEMKRLTKVPGVPQRASHRTDLERPGDLKGPRNRRMFVFWQIGVRRYASAGPISELADATPLRRDRARASGWAPIRTLTWRFTPIPEEPKYPFLVFEVKRESP